MGISAGAGGVIEGRIHLYSMEKARYQQLQGHAGCFATVKVPGRADPAQVLVFEEKKPDQPAKLFVMEVGRDKDAPGGVFRLQPQLIQFPAEAPNDFPVSMTSAPGQDVIFMITRMGYLFLFDILTGKTIYRTPNRVAKDTVFTTTTQDASAGVLGITARSGKVLQINLNEQSIVPYIVQVLRDNPLAIDIARRLNLPGARDLYVQEFNKLLASGDAAGAARLAATSPQGILRTQETVERFRAIPAAPGQPQPIFQYFSILLESGPLNKSESLQLVELAQGRTQLIEKWLTEDKLEASEVSKRVPACVPACVVGCVGGCVGVWVCLSMCAIFFFLPFFLFLPPSSVGPAIDPETHPYTPPHPHHQINRSWATCCTPWT